MIDFKVGDLVVCGCGSPSCVPFTIKQINTLEDGWVVIIGEEINEEPFTYVIPLDDQLRKLTKLEKALR